MTDTERLEKYWDEEYTAANMLAVAIESALERDPKTPVAEFEFRIGKWQAARAKRYVLWKKIQEREEREHLKKYESKEGTK